MFEFIILTLLVFLIILMTIEDMFTLYVSSWMLHLFFILVVVYKVILFMYVGFGVLLNSVLGGFICLIAAIYLIKKNHWGEADSYLLVSCGLFFGLGIDLIMFMFAFLLTSLIYPLILISFKKIKSYKQPIPFLPVFLLAFIIALSI